ncbi:CrpP-related protein [Achromobacter spanius]|uniref:CrpP-related protein n=1 Tax=Achromobacter spanius TaxID=217203 RepID=UPI00381B8A96
MVKPYCCERLTIWECPFLRAEAMPAHTGEPLPVWSEKVRVWEEGGQQAAAARTESRRDVVAAWLRALPATRRFEKTDAKSGLLFTASAVAASGPPRTNSRPGRVPSSTRDG